MISTGKRVIQPEDSVMKKKCNLWEKQLITNNPHINNQAISFHYDKGLDPELRRKYMLFATWLRKNYCFPVRVHVYILNTEKVRLLKGTLAYGSFRWFQKRSPRIKVPSKVEEELLMDYSLNEIHYMIMSSLVHELTHYYQWTSGLEQSNATSERQAHYYRYRILDQFCEDLPKDQKEMFEF